MKNQQLRKKYHKQLVRRSKKPGRRLTIGTPGSTKRWASKLKEN